MFVPLSVYIYRKTYRVTGSIWTGTFLNAGEPSPTPYGEKERIIGDLYGLFCVSGPEAPGAENSRRVYYQKESV